VIRPADPEEVAGAFVAAIDRQDGPTLMLLTRQKVPTLNDISVAARREGVLKGAYIAAKETGPLDLILIGTGSELQHALEAAKELGPGTRVVSMPCMERFDRQTESYREEILPAKCTRRVAIEAGVSGLWYKYVGTQGKVIGIDRFGISAPGDTVMKELGMTKDSVVSTAKTV
jgi:transketolase